MSAWALTQTILAFVAIVGVGALLRVTGAVTREGAKPLNAVIVYVGLPAFIFKAVYGAHIDLALARVVAVAWVVFAVMLAIGWAGARLLRLPPKIAGGFILAVALGNTGYLGYPIAQALFGQRQLPAAVFYDVFGTATLLVLVGFAIAQHYGESDQPQAHPLRELLTFPPVVALVLALLARPFGLPLVVRDGLELVSGLVAPLVMLSVGIALQFRSIKREAVPLATAVGLRLIVAPVLGFLVGSLVVGDGEALRLVVLQAGMPTMMLTLVVGDRFGLETDFIASAIFATTLLAAVTLPLGQLLAF